MSIRTLFRPIVALGVMGFGASAACSSAMSSGAASSPASSPMPSAAATGAWIVLLGSDTTAVEQYSRSGNVITGDLVTRAGGTVINHYVLTLNPNGSPSSIDVRYTRPDGSVPANGVRSARATYGTDSVTVVVMRDTAATRRFAVKGAHPVIGGLAASMGLYEAMLGHLRTASTTDSIAVFMLGPQAGQAPAAPAWVKFYGPDSVRMWNGGYAQYARVDRSGRLLGFSGRATTQKIEPRRVSALDIQAIATSFAAADASSRTVIAASLKDSVRARIGGANIAVDYFRPTARGRNVFSNGVLGDTIWRTGANNATELKTDKDLLIAGQTLPAGTYTLWTHVPANNSRYELIFNKQTKIWGTAYNPANDLLRVPLSVRPRSTPMEAFQISVDQAGNGGAIRLSWAGTDLSVPFTVKN